MGLSYCAETVRTYDHDRYLTAIFAPATSREALFALYAFNLEIAKTREVVTEPLIGRMRLQWWRDALDTLYAGGTIAHEVASPLGVAIQAGRLERATFDRLIDAREQDLEDAPPPDFVALEAYAEGTAAPLLELAMQAALGGAPLAVEERHAARHVGIAWALTGLARAAPFHARQGRSYLPEDRMRAVGASVARLYEFKPEPAMFVVVREMADRASSHIEQARAMTGDVRPVARSPLMTAELAGLYLNDLARSRWDPFSPNLRRGRPLSALRLALRAIRARF